MPVFIALYWVLMESVELRQAPFALWIEDLSVMDPYFVLLLMGASMYYMQKLNPAPPDPMRKNHAVDAYCFYFFLPLVPRGSYCIGCATISIDGPTVYYQPPNRERRNLVSRETGQ